MAAITPDKRATAMVAELLDALAGNLQAYTDVAHRTRAYRLYVFCRRHQAERRAFHSALAWLVTEDDATVRKSWSHRFHRWLVHLRIFRARRIGALIEELRQQDRLLRVSAERLLAEPGLDGAIWMVLSKLVSAIRATEADMIYLAGQRGAMRPMTALSYS